MIKTRVFAVFLAGTCLLGVTSQASAQCWRAGYPFYAGYWGNVYETSYVGDSVPYFALHPPVYYSYKVARTYGYSPFAYPPGVMTPDRECSSTRQQDQASPQYESQPEPQMIENPFVEPTDEGSSVTRSQKPAGRRPQIVYPTAVAKSE